MKVEENKEIVRTDTVIVGCNCDECGSIIEGPYWELTTGHHDWGNDSVDSIEEFDLCSKECVLSRLSKYFKACNNSHTQYFDLSQEFFKKDINDELTYFR